MSCVPCDGWELAWQSSSMKLYLKEKFYRLHMEWTTILEHLNVSIWSLANVLLLKVRVEDKDQGLILLWFASGSVWLHNDHNFIHEHCNLGVVWLLTNDVASCNLHVCNWSCSNRSCCNCNRSCCNCITAFALEIASSN